ncbi:beta-L-arabinofuranosidase domain-containing protein [Candidatus Latescibacterota bacterium]
MKRTIMAALVMAVLAISIITCSNQSQVSKETIRPASLADVTLLDSPFKAAQDREAEALLQNYDPDRFLARLRIAADLEPKAEVYQGWEARLTGHAFGHYISGCARAWVITKNPEFKRRVDYMIDELAEIQAAHGNGFVGGPPDTKNQFENHIATGDIQSAGFDLNGIWVPIYGMHKIFAGLNDAYAYAGNEKALEVEHAFGLWMYEQLMHLSDEDFVKIRACEHGGIQETFADLYAKTGDERMMELANRFYDPMLMDPLYAGEDNLTGLHANTQFPKYIGMARIYEITDSERERKVAEFFWDRVTNYHSYVTGGNSLGEHFGPPDHLNNRIEGNTTETCNTYNIIKLSSHVFTWNKTSNIADFMERAMLNHSLSALNPENSYTTYFLHLGQGVLRNFRAPHQFTCCEGSAMEHHFLYPEVTYYVGDHRVYINQFIASRFDWKDAGIVMTQNTGFPHEETSKVTIECDNPVTVEVFIRKPHWAEKGVDVTVNGDAVDTAVTDDGYISIDRKWQNGDVIDISFPFTLRYEAMPDNPDRIAVFHGPLALGADLGPSDDPDADNADYVPVFFAKGKSPDEWIRPADGTNTFETFGAGEPREVTLRPFYQLYNSRYSLYWDLFTPSEWETAKASYRTSVTNRRELETRTVDFVQPGEMQPERDHNLQGENTVAVEGSRRKSRRADDGWFSFDLKVSPSEPVALLTSYTERLSVNDKGSFDVEIDGNVLVTKELDWHGLSSLEDIYLLPEELIQGKEQVTVTFRSQPGSIVPPVGGLRVVKVE